MTDTNLAAENGKLQVGASNGKASLPLTPAERSKAYRARKRGRGRKRKAVTAVTRVTQAPVTKDVTAVAPASVTSTVAKTVTATVTDAAYVPQLLPQLAPQSTIQSTPQPVVTALPQQLASATLAVAALGLAAVGVTINGWFARSLGSTEVAGWLFAAIGVTADVAALVLPCCAAQLWRTRHRAAAITGWAAWVVTFTFAITARHRLRERERCGHYLGQGGPNYAGDRDGARRARRRQGRP